MSRESEVGSTQETRLWQSMDGADSARSTVRDACRWLAHIVSQLFHPSSLQLLISGVHYTHVQLLRW